MLLINYDCFSEKTVTIYIPYYHKLCSQSNITKVKVSCYVIYNLLNNLDVILYALYYH